MLRLLRAFAWLRWRVLLNSLERRGSRDVLERFSIAFEQLAPLIAAVVMLPSAAALAGAAAYAGWSQAHGEPAGLLAGILRILLLAATALAIAGPMMLPGGDRTNAVRLLLLPIPRSALYLAQFMSALADPWILLVAAIVVAFPLGAATAGNLSLAAVAAGAGLLLLAVLIGLTLLVTSTLHLIVRDRRRGELLTLVLVVVLPVLGMLPGLLTSDRAQRTRTESAEHRDGAPPRWWVNVEAAAKAALPSELYTRATRTSQRDTDDGSWKSLAFLLATGVGCHALAFGAFTRVLRSPGTVGSGRTATAGTSRRWRVPGTSAGTSAVAINQLRLALRTPRGRSTLLSPIVVFAVFAAMMLRGGSSMEFGPIALQSGIGLAAFCSFVSLMSVLPLAMNQFAVDRAGLTLAMLSPLDVGSLLRGKALGNAFIAALPAGLCIVGARLLFPGGDPAIWLSVPLALVATYVLVAPAAALLSALFPRAVDLNSIGSGSNAHGAAGLLGMLSFVAAGALAAAIAVGTARVLGRPALAPIALLLWIAVCLAISFGLFHLARDVFDRRRENIGLVSQRPA